MRIVAGSLRGCSRRGCDMAAATVQLLAGLMGAVHGVVWVLGSRWERPGRTAHVHHTDGTKPARA